MTKLKAVFAIFLAVTSLSVFAADAVNTHKLNINQASAKELMKLEGMSAYKAHAIVAYRKKNGSFKSLDKLGKVKGFQRIKAEKLQAITHQMSV